MKDLEGKVAVITGGGSGIGRGIALAVADAGMSVVIADIESDAAEAVAEEVRGRGVDGVAAVTDVSVLGSVQELAESVYARFGAAHLLCNNAGVVVMGTIDTMTSADWKWVLSVNLDGVVNGLQAFLPRMRDQTGQKHIVNTASAAGLYPQAGMGVYSASKYAIVSISEVLRDEAAGYGLGVSVLCPGVVRTNISNAHRSRPAELGGPVTPQWLTEMESSRDKRLEIGIDPLEVGQLVRQAVLDDELYILPSPETRVDVEARFQEILAAFDRAAPPKG